MRENNKKYVTTTQTLWHTPQFVQYSATRFLKLVHLSTRRCHGYRGLLKGHHTLSVLGSLNEKEMDKEEEWKNNIGRWSGKDKRLDGAVSYLLPAAAGFIPPPFLSSIWIWHGEKKKGKTNQNKHKSSEVEGLACWPVLEVGVVSEVSQPGLSYRLSQFIMMSCWQHPHQNFIER